MRDNGIRLQFAFIKATEGEKLVDPYFSRNWQLSRENGLLRGAYHYFPRRYLLQFRRDYFCKRWISHKAISCRAGRRRTGKIIGKRITQAGKSVAKNGRKTYGKKPIIYSGAVFITPIWRAISMNIRGGWLTIINVARTMTAWHGASGSILTVDRSMALMVRWILMCLMARWRSCRHSLMGLKKRLK